ncbi:MAG: NAD(P)/FAD-dependent oxidoreductase [Limisphaerales bacterium]
MVDIAILGSGFGGSLLACIARRLGRSVVLIERGRHPRFAIGESSTPLADLLWLELTRRHGLDALIPFAKWGTWRKAHPEVACGLKRGFAFYHHRFGRAFEARSDRSDQLLVAASPRDEIADTHWYRPDFDHFLVREAVREGVEYVDDCEVTTVEIGAGNSRIVGRRRGADLMIPARFVVDAGNRGGPLVRSLGLVEEALPNQPRTEALYAHFRGVGRLDGLPLHEGLESAPFPVDDAAVHHVFEGGWIWVLRFINGVTSAGVAAVEPVARRFRFEEGAPAWNRLLDELPTVRRQFVGSEPSTPFVHARQVGFRTGPAAGPGWALLPSAAGFVDPMLSSGFTLTLLGIERLARAIGKAWDDRARFEAALEDHAKATASELLALEQFVSALYARLGAGDFDGFTEVARLYFCVVIYSETARRLGRAGEEGGFLAKDHGELGTLAAGICAGARAGMAAGELRQRVDSVLSRFDLGGLEDSGRRPWYPVRAEDLVAARGRIRATDEEWEALVRNLADPLRAAGTGIMLPP